MPGSTRTTRTGVLISERRHTTGDAAVDGLLAGALAGIVMIAYLLGVGWLAGEGPASVLARFDPAGTASPLTGTLVHLAVSAVYGLLFGVAYRLIGRARLAGRTASVLTGLAYGLVLLLVARGLTGIDGRTALREIPAASFAVAHLVYGLVLGWLVGRN